MKNNAVESEAVTLLIPDLPLDMIFSHLYLSVPPTTSLLDIYVTWCYPEISFLDFQVVTFNNRLAQK
jgi:hypothetical protein